MVSTKLFDTTVKDRGQPFYLDRDALAAVKHLISTRERAGSDEIKYGITKVACNAIDTAFGRHARSHGEGRLHLSLFVHKASIMYRKTYYDAGNTQLKLLDWGIDYNTGLVSFGEYP